MSTDAAAGTVVLVHGGFVDGSGWQGVYGLLRKDGYSVAIPSQTLVDVGRQSACPSVLAVGRSFKELGDCVLHLLLGRRRAATPAPCDVLTLAPVVVIRG
jgi:hypothetical protein